MKEDKIIMSQKELKRKSILDLIKTRQLSIKEGAERMGVCYRQGQRIYHRYLAHGDKGLVHKSRGRPSSYRIDAAKKARILSLYQEKYWGFGPTLASEKLYKDDSLRVHGETLRLWLKAAGIWARQRIRKKHRLRRSRRERFGELLQMDGSIHSWFSGSNEKQCLMNLVDDATGKTLSLLAPGETTQATFELLKWWIELHGIPLAIYVDLKSLYVSPKSLKQSEEEVESGWFTHFSRVCHSLGIKIIKAYSPQAKGRVERNHGVYQDRFVKELRLRGINTISGANHLLANGFINDLNAKFMKPPSSESDAHIPLPSFQKLDEIFCWHYERKAQNDLTIRFENEFFQIERMKDFQVRPKQTITVRKNLKGEISLFAGMRQLPYRSIEAPLKTKEDKRVTPLTDHRLICRANKLKSPWNQWNPGWLQKTGRVLSEVS